MQRFRRTLLSMTLAVSLGIPPQAFAAFAAGTLFLSALLVPPKPAARAGQLYSSPEAALARITPGIAPENRAAYLEKRAAKVLGEGAATVSSFTNEVIQFQSMFILLAVLSFQASR